MYTRIIVSKWSKRFIERKDWKRYNKELMKGEFYLDFSFIDRWYDEFAEASRSKRGGQFLFPSSF
ncbi:MAG: IS5/IS1182 family transposase, partial [Nitrososphaerota archaeon]